MKSRSRLYISFLVVLFTALLIILSGLDNDRETLSKAGISSQKPAIIVNQVGYLPQWHKKAFFRQSMPFSPENKNSTSVQVIVDKINKPVASIPLQPEALDPVTQDTVATIDFSSVNQPGTYYLQLGKLKSVPFTIGRDIYQQPLVTLLRSYYLQRCGIEIDDPVTGISHPPCHLKDAIIAHQDQYHAAGKLIPTVGGWHDTGAYNKYVATSTVSIARLLSLYEEYPNLFPDNHLNIPESGNNISDLLDEMRLGLDWLVKMQRPDGAVYRKLSGKTWPVGLAPNEDIQPRYIYGISTPETAKFAAVMAIASRNYQSLDFELAAKYLTAAESAWQYLQKHTKMQVDWVEGDDTGSDKYLASDFDREASLTTDIDDRLWAATELYITTGETEFANYFAEHLGEIDYTLFEWKNPAPLALINYLKQKRQPTSDELVNQIKFQILQRADLILGKVNQSIYRLANDRFIWGSNKMAAEEGITLVYAYQLTKNPDYLNAAINQLDYLLGRNHFNQTFITGIGTNPVQHLSNLYVRAKKIHIPGLVVGGPNGHAQDGIAVLHRGQLSYIDDERSYTTNENAIDYNASVISLIVNLIMQIP
ncbi:MAG: glycoside hydrolase family 9 protein [Waterburya sp.]